MNPANQPPLHQQLSTALARLTIHSPTAFTVDGEPPFHLAAPHPGAGTGRAQDPLVHGLQSWLYARCYAGMPASDTTSTGNSIANSTTTSIGNSIGNTSPGLAQETATEEFRFLQSLSTANRSQDRWDGGWTVEAVQARGDVTIRKGDRQRTAMAGEFIGSQPGRPVREGDLVSLRIARESTQLLPGFYFAFSDALADAFEEAMTVRLYFHVPATHAPVLVETVTGALDTLGLPFRFKCLSKPAFYNRTDAAVLYVGRRYLQAALRRLQEHMPSTLRQALGGTVPLFTRPLGPGMGLAEDPGNGESFGMHRCRLVAEGIVDAWRQGRQTVDARWQAFCRRFANLGLRIDRPHLNAGSAELPTSIPTGGLAL